MNDKERLKIILDNSIYDHNFEEFTVPLKDMDWLIEQAERAQELEEEQKLLRKQVEGIIMLEPAEQEETFEIMIELLKEYREGDNQ